MKTNSLKSKFFSMIHRQPVIALVYVYYIINQTL